MNRRLCRTALTFVAVIPFFAQAHTSGIGLRAAESGGIQVWYRAWHACTSPLFEGQIKIEGINGTTYGPTSAQASLTSCDSVGGTSTFPTFESTNVGYYCEVNAQGQILNLDGTVNSTALPSLGFDPASPKSPADMGGDGLQDGNAAGAILCNDPQMYAQPGNTDKWQGSTYTDLSAGQYRVTYVPDPNPSADWQVSRQLVLSTDITVSAALAAAANPDRDGDGVPDEVDAYPDDPTRAYAPVPTLPLFGLIALGGLLGLFGIRKISK